MNGVSLVTRGLICPENASQALGTRGVICPAPLINIVDFPVHIKDVAVGDYLKIILVQFKHLLYVEVANGAFELIPGVPKRKKTPVWERTIIEGPVLTNDSVGGQLTIAVARQRATKAIRATIPYSYIIKAELGKGVIHTASSPEYLKGVPLAPRVFFIPVRF